MMRGVGFFMGEGGGRGDWVGEGLIGEFRGGKGGL